MITSYGISAKENLLRHCILLFVLIDACLELYDVIVDFMLDHLCEVKVGFMLSLAELGTRYLKSNDDIGTDTLPKKYRRYR